MDASLTQLCRFFDASKHRDTPMALATIVRTEGSTYRKAGARILIAADGGSSGLLSGGCLEGELRELANQVMASGQPHRHWFDTRNDDPVWGLGLGCEGAMDVWIEPVNAGNGFGPLPYLQRCLEGGVTGTLVTVIGGAATPQQLGRHGFHPEPARDALAEALQIHSQSAPGIRSIPVEGRKLDCFVTPIELPIRVLLCGAGRDVIPVHAFVAALGWSVTVYDHRPVYADPALFPQAGAVLLGRPEELEQRVDLQRIDAAVIMSHHLASDVAYLDVLSRFGLRYIGLLGPATRRERILRDLGRPLGRAETAVYGPVGLDIGASTPEAIALSIVAQMHAALSVRDGGHFDPTHREIIVAETA
jgi:xanthine/CO dehydrogenase XdhC/CoxF family maturation factor